MQAFFDRLSALTFVAKLGILGGVIFALAGGYWYFIYSSMQDEEAQLVKTHNELLKEKQEYETRKKEYLAFRNEVNALLEEQKELIKVLPKKDDIEQFIESVQAQIELAGLSKVESVREAAVPVDMYVKIPVRMSLVGSFHQIDHFFKNVGDLKRIVNIEDLALEPVSLSAPIDGPNPLKANFVATTFQFIDKGAGGQKGGTSITAGGK